MYMNEKLTDELVINISKSKGEPKWMLDFRLKALHKFKELDMPNFGPKIDIDFSSINYYRKVANNTNKWENVNCDIRNRFKDLGVIDAEKKYLGGVTNQWCYIPKY